MKDSGGGGGERGPGASGGAASSLSPSLPRYDPKRKRAEAAATFKRLVLVPLGVFFGGASLLAVARLAHGGSGAEDATAAVWQSLKEPPAALYRCMNGGGSPPAQQTTYDDFAAGKPARLRLRKAWWSRRPLPAAQAPLTIATGLNPGRLDQLESQCQSWGGPLSAAVYLVLPQYEGYEAGNEGGADGGGGGAASGADGGSGKNSSSTEEEEDESLEGLTPASRTALAEAERAVSEFHARAEAGENGMRCRLDAMLLYETVADSRMAVLLPINAMRNYALLQARSPLVAMVDVDLVVSSALGEWLTRPANVELLRAGAAARRVFVLPAFETAPQDDSALAHELADGAARMAKPALASLTAARLVYQFALYLFRQGHNCTDYPRWFRSDAPYDIAPYDGYEPWFATGRLHNPFYDAVYRGYGWNKVSHVDNVKHRNFTFVAHPTGFLVHRQHARSSADKMYQEQKGKYEEGQKAGAGVGDGGGAGAGAGGSEAGEDESKRNLAALTHGFRDAMLAAMQERRYVPAVDEGVQACLRQLGWWKGYTGMDL